MTYCFPRPFTPSSISRWCKAHGLRPVTGRLVRGVYHVAVSKITRRRRSRRNPSERAPAVFVGWQSLDVPGRPPRGRIALYNLTAPLAGHPKGSTVTAATLRAAGYEPPEPGSSNPRRRRRARRNPRGSVVVYPQLEAIEARKADGKLYRHKFTSKPRVIGTAGGSIRIPRVPGKGPLWGVL